MICEAVKIVAVSIFKSVMELCPMLVLIVSVLVDSDLLMALALIIALYNFITKRNER
jgi:hypothetical protein